MPQLRFNSWQGEGKAAAAEGSRGSSGLGNPEGWSVRIRREERGARWPERGGQDLQERGTPKANARPRRESGRGRKKRARMQDLGLEGRTDRPEGRGRREPHGVGGAGRRARRTRAGEPRGRRPGGFCVALKFGAGGSGSENANVGRVLRGVQGRPGRVIAGKSKWRVKLVRLPGGGEQAGECGQEHEAGQESRGGREAVGTE